MLSGNFAEMTSTPFRDLLHAADLRHGTDGFTFPPKEGVLRIFSPLKIRRLRPGLNPRTWVLKIAEADRPQVTIWYMCMAWWIHKATKTDSKYVIRIAFPQQQCLHERAYALRYTYIACLVVTTVSLGMSRLAVDRFTAY